MSSLTNVWFPEAARDELRRAAKHYHFESLAGYFRICGEVLCDHYRRKDKLTMPLSFELQTKKAKND